MRLLISGHRLTTAVVRDVVALLLSTSTVAGLAIGLMVAAGHAGEPQSIAPTVRLQSPHASDQDDMCIWVHPRHADQSLVIASDKSAGRLFVYDLQGQVLQEVSVTKPGNIDLRQRVSLGKQLRDLVVVNLRAGGFRLAVFEVDVATRKLQRMDNDDLATGPNYGGCLYHSRKNGQLSFICTSETGAVEQHELFLAADGRIGSRKLRSWLLGKSEGAVADDETGLVYIAEEAKGVWRFPADPDQPAIGTLVVPIGQNGLKGDVEGLALRTGPQGTGLLVVSDQGANRYAVYQRQSPHAFVTAFSIEGAHQTDGIELISAPLGPAFPEGLFACHTDRVPRPVLLTGWQEIARQVPILKKDAVAP